MEVYPEVVLKTYAMINIIKKIIFITLVFSLVNCEDNNDRFLIKEGYGVDIYKLGVKTNEYQEKIDGITLMSNKDSLINAIDIKSSAYYTHDGIKVGIDYKEVVTKRGVHNTTKVIDKANPINQEKSKIPHSMRYDGITFFLDDTGEIIKIRIY